MEITFPLSNSHDHDHNHDHDHAHAHAPYLLQAPVLVSSSILCIGWMMDTVLPLPVPYRGPTRRNIVPLFEFYEKLERCILHGGNNNFDGYILAMNHLLIYYK